VNDREADRKWDERLQCHVVSLHYDFRSRRGQLCMADGDCCDMDACTSRFEGVDPDVEIVMTHSGAYLDTVYRKEAGSWKAYAPSPDANNR
jgi:hypothetical protein